MIVWDRSDYIAEKEKQLNSKSVYKNVVLKERMPQDLAETNSNVLKSPGGKGKMTKKQLNYFTNAHKKATKHGKVCLLPKIYKKKVFNVPGKPVILNCNTPIEKASQFLERHLKGIMQESWSYIKDSNDFINKTKNLKEIPKGKLLVTTYVPGLYPSIPHGVKTLKEAIEGK